MRSTLVAVALVVFAGNMVRGDDKPLEGDLKKLQGRWITQPAAGVLYFTFDKNTLVITVVAPMGEERTIVGDFTIDEKGSPKQMDWLNMKNGKDPLPNRLAIYEFDGEDKLKIAGGPDEKTRPKDMVEKTGDSQSKGNALVFTRVKSEKK